MPTKQQSQSKTPNRVFKQERIISLMKRGKLALAVDNEKDCSGVRRYRIVADDKQVRTTTEVPAQ